MGKGEMHENLDKTHVDYLKTMSFIWIAQDIHHICYVYN